MTSLNEILVFCVQIKVTGLSTPNRLPAYFRVSPVPYVLLFVYAVSQTSNSEACKFLRLVIGLLTSLSGLSLADSLNFTKCSWAHGLTSFEQKWWISIYPTQLCYCHLFINLLTCAMFQTNFPNMAHLYSQFSVLYLWTLAASFTPLHLTAPLCLVFSSAVTALAFKLSTVITRASHFNKSAVKFIPQSVLSRWLTAVLTLSTSLAAHTHVQSEGWLYNNAILKMSAAPFNFIGFKASG